MLRGLEEGSCATRTSKKDLCHDGLEVVVVVPPPVLELGKVVVVVAEGLEEGLCYEASSNPFYRP